MSEKQKRGFACLTPEARLLVSSKGGKAAHASGKAHRWTSAEAKLNGHKGGKATMKNRFLNQTLKALAAMAGDYQGNPVTIHEAE